MDKFEKLRNIALPNTSSSCDYFQLPANDFNDLSENESKFSEFRQFSEKLICLDNNGLNRVLDDFDLKHKVNEHDPKTEEIVTATETLVNGILQAAGDIDTRFLSKCIYSGSYYDGLKVGSADEFDFVARIDSLSKPGVLEARRSKRKPGFVYLVVKDVSVLDDFREFLTTPDGDACLEENDMVLNVDTFQDYFEDLIFAAINSIDIPECFIPSKGFDADTETQSYWRPFRHGPCATLQLSYQCQSLLEVVDLDIDIAPSIAYPEMHYMPPVLEKLENLTGCNSFLDILKDICFATEVMLVPFRFDYTEPSGRTSWHYHYSNTWRVSHSSIEKAVFSLYGKDSVEKKICRVLKILKEMYLQGTVEVEEKSESRRFKLQEPPSTRLDFCTVEEVSSVLEKISFSSDTNSDEEFEFLEEDEQLSFEDDLIGQENIGEVEQYEEEGACHTAQASGNVSQEDVFVEKGLDQSVEIIYDRKSEIESQNSVPGTSSSIYGLTELFRRFETQKNNDTKQMQNNILDFDSKSQTTLDENKALYQRHLQSADENEIEVISEIDDVETHTSIDQEEVSESGLSESNIDEQLRCINTQTEMSNDTNETVKYIPDFDKRSQQSCHIVGDLCEDLEPLAQSSKRDGNTSLSARNFELDGASAISSNVRKMKKINTEDNKEPKIYYRDSKPLLKTYMIKMLFLAMKTAYPDQDSWEPDQLSVLFKMALCMIYFAHNCNEKGIYNFWFQDLIENRTRESTCTEMLYCLDLVVMHLSQMIKHCKGATG